MRENRGGGAVVHERGWGGGVAVHNTPRYYHSYGVARRPIYNVYARPVFHERYFDYRYRPRMYVESWAPRYGYIWVNGSWNWDGAEWIWTPGYYSPDPAFVEVY